MLATTSPKGRCCGTPTLNRPSRDVGRNPCHVTWVRIEGKPQLVYGDVLTVVVDGTESLLRSGGERAVVDSALADPLVGRPLTSPEKSFLGLFCAFDLPDLIITERRKQMTETPQAGV